MVIDKIIENKNSDKIALIYMERRISYKQLYCTLAYNKHYLESVNHNEGNLYILKASSQFKFVIALLSLIACQTWVVPVNKSMKETDAILEVTNASCLSEQDIAHCCTIREDSKYDLEIVDGDKCGVYHISSGSTGIPKFCKRSMNCFYQEAISFRKTFSYSKNEQILSLCPLEHSFAFGAAFINALENEMTLHIIDEFKPRTCLKYIIEGKISILILVPAMAKMFCMIGKTKKKYDLSGVHILLVGAGTVTEELYQDFYECFGTKLLGNFGSSETGCIISRTSTKNIKSVGKAMYGVQLKICNDLGEKVADDEEGQLYVKWKGMLTGYFSKEVHLDSDGFFALDDLAVRDKEGNIYIKGRMKNIINIGGKKINPVEVEDALLEIAAVEDCKVFSVKRQSGDDMVKAYVVGKNIDKSKIFKYLGENLSSYKIPTILEEVPKIERNAMGKVQKDKLI